MAAEPWTAAAPVALPLCITVHQACDAMETWLATTLQTADSTVELTTTTPWIGATATRRKASRSAERRRIPLGGAAKSPAAKVAAAKEWALLGSNSESNADWRPKRSSPNTTRTLRREKQRFESKAATAKRAEAAGQLPLAAAPPVARGRTGASLGDEPEAEAALAAAAAVPAAAPAATGGDAGGDGGGVFLTAVAGDGGDGAAAPAVPQATSGADDPFSAAGGEGDGGALSTLGELRRALASMLAVTDLAIARAAQGVSLSVDEAQLDDATARGRKKRAAERRHAAFREACAATLQRTVRCSFSRLALRTLRARRTVENRRAATLQLQQTSRGFKARNVRRARQHLKEVAATAALQRVWRGQRARWRCHALRAQRHDDARRATAASQLQRRARGTVYRKKAREKKQGGAAGLLQRAHRRRSRLRAIEGAAAAAAARGGGAAAAGDE